MSDVNKELQAFYYFPSAVYAIDKPEFLKDAKLACELAIEKQKKDQPLDEIYPAYMTGNLFDYDGMDKFAEFVGQTAWNILFEQGYKMNELNTHFTEMWAQEHHKHSSMEQHVHNYGSQIVGFYFVDVPENSSRAIFHDPRAGKVQINLPEENVENATPASNMINFEPKEGLLLFSNAWLPHSFTRHSSEKPIRFIHFNLGVQPAPAQTTCKPAEVI